MFVVSCTCVVSLSDTFVQIYMSQLTDITQCTTYPHADFDETILNIGSLYGIKTHYNFLEFDQRPVRNSNSSFGENICSINVTKLVRCLLFSMN